MPNEELEVIQVGTRPLPEPPKTLFGKAQDALKNLRKDKHTRELEELERRHEVERAAIRARQAGEVQEHMQAIREHDPNIAEVNRAINEAYNAEVRAVGPAVVALAGLVKDWLKEHKVTDEQARAAHAAAPQAIRQLFWVLARKEK